jgi:hypothetical protein
MKIMMFEDVKSNVLFLVPAEGEPDALDSLRGFRPDGDFSYRGESSEFSENDGKGPIAVITDDSRIRLPGNNLHLEMMHHHFRQSPRLL